MNEYERRYKDDEDEGMGLLGPLAAVAAFTAARRLSTPFGKALMENSETARAAGKALSGLSEAGSALGRDFDKMVGQSDTLSLLQTAGHMGQKRVASDLPITGKLGDFSNWKTALKQAGNDYKQLYGGIVDTARAVPHLKGAKQGVNLEKHLSDAERLNVMVTPAARTLRETYQGTQFEKLYGKESLNLVAAMADRDGISPNAAILRFMNLADKGQLDPTKASLTRAGADLPRLPAGNTFNAPSYGEFTARENMARRDAQQAANPKSASQAAAQTADTAATPKAASEAADTAAAPKAAAPPSAPSSTPSQPEAQMNERKASSRKDAASPAAGQPVVPGKSTSKKLDGVSEWNQLTSEADFRGNVSTAARLNRLQEAQSNRSKALYAELSEETENALQFISAKTGKPYNVVKAKWLAAG